MRMMKRMTMVALLCLFPLMLTCGGGGGGGGGNGGNGGGGGGPEASAKIGASGGTVEVTNAASPLYGVKIEIPAGALSKETTVTINKAVNLPSSPFGSDSHGIVAEIGPSGTTFEVPATITIPYKDDADESFLGVFVYSEGEAGWMYLPFSFIDKNSNTAVFKISHLTPYYLTKFPKLRSGVHKFFIEAGFDDTAKATIQAATRNGTFLPYFDCTGIAFQEVTSKNEADFVVKLGTPQTPDENGKLVDIPAGFKWTSATQAEIVIRNNIKLHVNETLPVPADALDLYSLFVHELSHYFGIGTILDKTDPDYPQNGVFDDKIGGGDIARVLVPEDIEIFKQKYPECQDCINIAGTWSGTVSDGTETLPITLNLTQAKCDISGTISSPDSCPALCGYSTGAIGGNVSKNIFTFDIPQDPRVECDTCKFICFGRDYGSLTVSGAKMTGTAQSEDCETGEYFPVTLDLTRQNAGTISAEGVGKGRTSKSGFFPRNPGAPLKKGKLERVK